MSQDPYGFPETSTGTASEDASAALWLGVGAACLASVGMCLMYVPYCVALPMGAYAAYRGYRVVSGAAAGDPRDRTMATAGMVAGAISGGISALFVLLVIFYVAFLAIYMGGILAFLASGAADSPPL